jgi:hypothetical protein
MRRVVLFGLVAGLAVAAFAYLNNTGLLATPDAASYRLLPVGYSGGIWTNRIDRIAPLASRLQ